jgi:predicted DsbA family dithiol-disulfide isomerase
MASYCVPSHELFRYVIHLCLCRLLLVLLNLQEQYVNDTEFLLAAAEAAGLPRDAAAAALEQSGAGEQLVQQELGKFPGVNGVPHFVVNGRCDVVACYFDQLIASTAIGWCCCSTALLT